MAQQAIVKLCGFLEESLQQAEEQAQRDRLQRLQRQQEQVSPPSTTLADPTKLPPLPPSADVHVPFWQGIAELDLGLDSALASVPQQQQQQQQLLRQEEEYRTIALDYSQGHVAAKVKESRSSQPETKSASSASSSSLLAALLKSAAAQSTPIATTGQSKNDETASTFESKNPATAAKGATTSSTATTKPITPPRFATNDDDDDDEEATAIGVCCACSHETACLDTNDCCFCKPATHGHHGRCW